MICETIGLSWPRCVFAGIVPASLAQAAHAACSAKLGPDRAHAQAFGGTRSSE